jgi:beta-lactamase regulating signal transducer with metallopeptidase domain
MFELNATPEPAVNPVVVELKNPTVVVAPVELIDIFMIGGFAAAVVLAIAQALWIVGIVVVDCLTMFIVLTSKVRTFESPAPRYTSPETENSLAGEVVPMPTWPELFTMKLVADDEPMTN